LKTKAIEEDFLVENGVDVISRIGSTMVNQNRMEQRIGAESLPWGE